MAEPKYSTETPSTTGPRPVGVLSPWVARGLRCAAALLIALVPSPVQALDFDWGDLSVNLDSTLSYGAQWRVEKQDPNLISPENGGTNPEAANSDNGNANYSRGFVSNLIKGTHELELSYDRVLGAFGRVTYFLDFHNAFKDELSNGAKEYGAYRIEPLDAYVSGNFGPLAVRLGWQVVSWGEGLFYQNGINSANTVSLPQLRVPGSEIREALLPSPMLWSSWAVTENVSLEGYYNAQFRRTRLEACGTYFSTTDLFCEGESNPLSFGAVALPRGENVEPDNWQEYGLALRLFAPFLHNTEFGLFFLQHHARGPILSARGGRPFPTYVAEYPENIRLLGLSFNTDLFSIGIQGEYAHRFNHPFQTSVLDTFDAVVRAPEGELVSGFTRLQAGQYTLVLSRDFASYNPFFADNMQLIVETAVSVVYERPGEDEPQLESLDVADDIAWGYQALLLVDYFNVIGPIGLRPQIRFSHDAIGTSPQGGNFVQGRIGLTVSLTATYLNSFALDLAYSGFYGARYTGNSKVDRDFVGATFKYFL